MNSRGVVLVISLWIITIMMLFVLGVGFRMSIEARMTDYKIKGIRNSYLAQAAVNTLKAVLEEDSTDKYDVFTDGWCDSEEFFDCTSDKDLEGSFTVSYTQQDDESGDIAYGAIDEQSMINLNMATKEILTRLLTSGGAEGNAEEIAESILVWRGDASISAGRISEDNTYYGFLDFPYIRKNAEFDSKEELLLIKGIDTDLILYDAIKDSVTVYGTGGVNLNTARDKVLEALGLDRQQGVAEILTYRRGPDNKIGTEDDGVFESVDYVISDVLSSDSDKAVMTELNGSALVGVASNAFRAHVTASSRDKRVIKKVEAVVSKDADTLLWYED